MEIELKKGIEVTVTGIHQWGVYNGLLEGLPTDKMNELILKRIIARAKELCFIEEYFIIEPEQTPIEYDRDYPFGVPMQLPGIVCIAKLAHHKPARDLKLDGSELILIWFQETFCFPIENKIVEKFKHVDWVKHARDFEY